MTLPTWSPNVLMAPLRGSVYPTRPILSSLSACEGRQSPLFQYDTGCRPNFTCRTFTALSVLSNISPSLLGALPSYETGESVRFRVQWSEFPEAVLHDGRVGRIT